MIEVGRSTGPGGDRRTYHCDACERETVIDTPSEPGVCRVCGCTQEAGCVVDPAGNVVAVVGDTLPIGCSVCTWVEPDLCSACVEGPPPPLLYDAHGHPLRGAP